MGGRRLNSRQERAVTRDVVQWMLGYLDRWPSEIEKANLKLMTGLNYKVASELWFFVVCGRVSLAGVGASLVVVFSMADEVWERGSVGSSINVSGGVKTDPKTEILRGVKEAVEALFGADQDMRREYIATVRQGSKKKIAYELEGGGAKRHSQQGRGFAYESARMGVAQVLAGCSQQHHVTLANCCVPSAFMAKPCTQYKLLCPNQVKLFPVTVSSSWETTPYATSWEQPANQTLSKRFPTTKVIDIHHQATASGKDPNPGHTDCFMISGTRPGRSIEKNFISNHILMLVRHPIAPDDLLIEIAPVLKTRSDILNLCLTSNYVFANVSSIHYKTVILQSIEQCSLALGMLHRRSDIARHVRQLVIRPQGKFRLLVRSMNGAAASAAVRKLAGAMCLDALVRFTWGEPV
ncbi:hypothetical protein B0H34DRAFT_675927 [Crassisporium funariophilum]|nr:hypothetical protein B0H34DRAFT_675927 [Crassisporium funariophilum]